MMWTEWMKWVRGRWNLTVIVERWTGELDRAVYETPATSGQSWIEWPTGHLGVTACCRRWLRCRSAGRTNEWRMQGLAQPICCFRVDGDVVDALSSSRSGPWPCCRATLSSSSSAGVCVSDAGQTRWRLVTHARTYIWLGLFDAINIAASWPDPADLSIFEISYWRPVDMTSPA